MSAYPVRTWRAGFAEDGVDDLAPVGPRRRTDGQTRNGRTDLFAALNAATGEVLTDCRERRNRCRRAAVSQICDA